MNKLLIGNTLRTLRNSSSLKISDVCESLEKDYDVHIKSSTLYSWESGRTLPPINEFLCLCSLYNCYNIFDTFEIYHKDYSNKELQLINAYNALSNDEKLLIERALKID